MKVVEKFFLALFRKKSHSWTFLLWQHTSYKSFKTYSDFCLNFLTCGLYKGEKCLGNLKSGTFWMTLSKKEYTNMFQQLKLFIYCSMNKQYVERIQNRKRLTCGFHVIWLRSETTSLMLKNQRQKEIENQFLEQLCDPQWTYKNIQGR